MNTFQNGGAATAAGVTYTLNLPTGLIGVNCTGATCSYNNMQGINQDGSNPGANGRFPWQIVNQRQEVFDFGISGDVRVLARAMATFGNCARHCEK